MMKQAPNKNYGICMNTRHNKRDEVEISPESIIHQLFNNSQRILVPKALPKL